MKRAVVLAIAFMAAGCSLWPTPAYRVASFENDYIFLEAKTRRACGDQVPLSLKPATCTTSLLAGINRMEEDVRLAVAAAKRGGAFKLQLAALKQDRKEVIRAVPR